MAGRKGRQGCGWLSECDGGGCVSSEVEGCECLEAALCSFE